MGKNQSGYITVLLIFSGLQAFSQPVKTGDILRIKLDKELIADTAVMRLGMGNIFFSADFDAGNFRLPVNWKNAEVAAIIEKNSTVFPVYIARYKDETGSFKYYIDRNSNNSFLDEEELEFRKATAALKIADVIIGFRMKTDSLATRKIVYQILVTTEGRYYEYALKKEYSTGTFRSDGVSRKIELYTSFREPFYSSTGKGLIMAMDINANGAIHKTADYLDSVIDKPVRNEIIWDVSTPVIAGNTAFQFRQMDPDGKWIEFEKVALFQSFAEGSNIPDTNHFFTGAERKEIEKISLNKAPLTLLILSSTSCIPCERIRPALNNIAEEFVARGLTSFILLREQSTPEINGYFAEHLYKAKPLFSNDASWHQLNPATIVPMFYLVNKKGEIVYKSIGAGDQQAKLLRWYIKTNLP
jgi:thiol-disulfide isomerase/thioredoxin